LETAASRKREAALSFASDFTTKGEALSDLEPRLRTIYADRHDKTIFIAGAASLRYKAIIGCSTPPRAPASTGWASSPRGCVGGPRTSKFEVRSLKFETR
jgi:hypothetical protein